MEAAGTSEEEDDIDSQDSNIPIDHGHLAWNCSIKIITPAVKASVVSLYRLGHGCVNHDTEGKRFKLPIHCCDVTSLPICSVASYVLPPCIVNSCLCTPCAVCAPSSASLCSEHINRTQWTAVVGDIASPTSHTMCHSCAPVDQAIHRDTFIELFDDSVV